MCRSRTCWFWFQHRCHDAIGTHTHCHAGNRYTGILNSAALWLPPIFIYLYCYSPTILQAWNVGGWLGHVYMPLMLSYRLNIVKNQTPFRLTSFCGILNSCSQGRKRVRKRFKSLSNGRVANNISEPTGETEKLPSHERNLGGQARRRRDLDCRT